MEFPLHLLLCTVFLLNAAVFVDLALYLAVDLFLKLRHVEVFPGCRNFIGDVSRVELEMQIRLILSLKPHAPRVTERQCLIPKTVSKSCW